VASPSKDTCHPPKTAQIEIARLIARQRPFRDNLAELRGRRGQHPAVRRAQDENIRVARLIGGGKLRREFESRSIRTGHRVAGKVGRAQIEIALAQRVRRVVGLIDQDRGGDRRGDGVEDRELHGEAELQRTQADRRHGLASASK
jgi:hypothetical protein